MIGRPSAPPLCGHHLRRGRLRFGPLKRELAEHGYVTTRQIADFYGVSRCYVRDMAKNGLPTFTADRWAIKLKVLPFVIWGDAFFDEALVEYDMKDGKRKRCLVPDEVRDLRRIVAAGLSMSAAAKRLGLDKKAVQRIVRRETYKDVA